MVHNLIILFSFTLALASANASNWKNLYEDQQFHNVSEMLSSLRQSESLEHEIISKLPILALSMESSNSSCNLTSLFLQSPDGWIVQMLDASAKIEPGIMQGNLKWFGNYDQCVSLRVPENGTKLFGGKYCLATILPTTNNSSGTTEQPTDGSTSTPAQPWMFGADPIMINSIRAMQQNKEETDARAGYDMLLTALGGLQIAFCMPSTCGADDLQDRLNEILNLTEFEAFVSPTSCSTDEQKSFEPKDWGMISVLIVFAVLIVLSTGYDVLLTLYGAEQIKGRWQNFFVAFSFYSNGKRLLSTSSSSDTMGCFHGIRFFSMMWVVLGHKLMEFISVPLLNFVPFFEVRKDWQKMAILNAFLSVDTFFLLSGILLVYVFLKEIEKTKRFNLIDLLVFYLHRYIRLTPALAIVVGLNATLFYFIGSGPLWNASASIARDACAQSWWKTLIYVNNYKYMKEFSGAECVGQAWYLQVDMQLYWISPAFLYPLWKWPSVGLWLLGLLTVLCIALPFWLTIDMNLPWTVVITSDKIMDYMSYIYVPTYCRGSVYFMGAMLGYYLYKTRNQKVHIPKWLVALGWLLSTAVCLTVLYSLIIVYDDGYVYDAVEAAFYSSLHRVAWAAGIGWVIFACVKGYGGPVNAILSWKPFQPLSRLTYCSYLVHFLILNYMMGTARTTDYYSDSRFTEIFLGDMVLTLLLAAIFSLAFESPILIIEKEIFRKGGQRNSRPQERQPHVSNVTAVAVTNGTAVPVSNGTAISVSNGTAVAVSNGHANGGFIHDDDHSPSQVVVFNQKPIDSER